MKLRYWGSMPEMDKAHIDALVKAAAAGELMLEVEFVDVLEQGDRAITEHIIVTPTLDRVEPKPTLRLIAITGDAEKVLKKIKE